MQRIYVLLLPAALLLHSCGTPASGKPGILNDDTIPVQVLRLDRQAPSQDIPVSGQFTTDDETNLSFKTGGIIQNVLVREGDAVREGELLATLDLTEINAQVAQAQLAQEKAERDFQRVTHLYQDSVATLEQLQNARTALDIARQQLNAVKFNQSYSEIRAPRSGYVLRKLANPGQQVSPGTPVLQTNGAGSGHWLLRVGLSDGQWAGVHIGDKALVSTDALPGQTITGTINRKSEGVDPAAGTFTADIEVPDAPRAALAAGMFGKATIEPRTNGNGGNVQGRGDAARTQTWAIPYQSLLDGDGSTGFVFVTRDGHTAQKVAVTISGMQKDQVLVNGGLEHDSALIVTGSAYLTDGSPIRIISTNGKP